MLDSVFSKLGVPVTRNLPSVLCTPKMCTANNSRSVFGVTVLKNNHKCIRQLRDYYGHPSHHGNKLWDASLVLIDYFNRGGTQRRRPIPKKSTVLEVGCGWAITALYCAKALKCQVAGLDIDASVLPFASLHAKLNGVAIDTYAKSYQKASAQFLSGFDAVVGGDICFWDELEKPLYNLVRRANKQGVRVILADPGRAPFMAMAEKACDKLDAKLIPWHVSGVHKTSAWILDVEP